VKAGTRISRGQWLLLAFCVLSALALFVLVTGIGPDLPGPRIRETLGLAAPTNYEPCVPSREGDRTPPLPRGVEGEWSREPGLPDPRDELRAATIGRRIYIGGGNGVDGNGKPYSLPSFSVFDTRSGRYRRLPDFPLGLDHPLMAAHSGDVYVVGGASNGTPQAGLYRYSPQEGAWEELAPMRVARFSPTGAVIGDRLYVVGGAQANADDTYASMEIYEFETGEWTTGPSMPTARHHAAAAVVAGDLYVAGGRQPGDFSLDSFERFDPASGSWEELPPIPEGTGGPASVASHDQPIVIAGGDDLEDDGIPPWVTGAVYAFDPVRTSWERLPDLNVPRHGHAATTAAGRAYVFGGSPCPDYGRTGSVESLEL
jgi:N-acetylneuraminic acid mutarotase